MQSTKINNKIKIKKIQKIINLCVQTKLKIKIYKTFQKEFHQDSKIKNYIKNLKNDIDIYQKTIQKIIEY